MRSLPEGDKCPFAIMYPDTYNIHPKGPWTFKQPPPPHLLLNCLHWDFHPEFCPHNYCMGYILYYNNVNSYEWVVVDSSLETCLFCNLKWKKETTNRLVMQRRHLCPLTSLAGVLCPRPLLLRGTSYVLLFYMCYIPFITGATAI